MLACMYPKVTRVNVRCMPHHAVVVLVCLSCWQGSSIDCRYTFEKSGKFYRYCVLFDIDLTVRGVALRPTTTDGQNFVLQTIRNSHIEPLQNKFVQKINFHYHKASPPPRSKNLCGVWVCKRKPWSLFCVDAMIGSTVFCAKSCVCWNTGVFLRDLLRGHRSRIDSKFSTLMNLANVLCNLYLWPFSFFPFFFLWSWRIK